ncbi:MAG TPA: hypothetical protein VF786_04610, partial [Terriglobales bacterium]
MRKTSALLLVILICAVALFATTFSMPRVQPAASYALHDVHPQEHLALGADPYDTKEKAKIFSVNWAEKGILPILVVVSNDGDQPAALVDGHFELVLRNREKLEPMREGDLFRVLTHIKNPSSGRHLGDTLPIPIPQGRRAKGGVS